MSKYITQERAKYWPITPELLIQYMAESIEHYGWRAPPDRDANLLICHKNGLWHRDDDKPAVIDSNGNLKWYQRHLLHRDGDKPAVIFADGHLQWFQNGHLHRSCGPAVIMSNDIHRWWINGTHITHEVNEWLDGKEWCGTTEQIFEFQLRFT